MPEDDALFLVFEGMEGAGKSTQIRRVASRLEERGVPFTVVREPGSTPAGERIREVVLDAGLDLEPETELLLMLAARAEFVRKEVEPGLARGDVVLADRYELSSFAYQGLARDLGLERVRELNRFATGGRRPDATILLLVSPSESLRRRDGEAADRMEGEGEAFHRAVARAYRKLAREEAGVIAVDADGPEEDVEERVLGALASRWPDVFGSPTGS